MPFGARSAATARARQPGPTPKRREKFSEVARLVPLGRLLVETDCPFLAPVPLRGRRNEPAFVVETARFLAELRGVSPEELGRVTSENFARLFGVGPTSE